MTLKVMHILHHISGRELLFNTFLVVVGAAVQADPALELDLAALGGGVQTPQ